MSGYVLDTDTLSLLMGGHEPVCRHVAAADPSELAITIINVEEMLSGWYTQLRRARSDEHTVRAYAALQETIVFATQVRILRFDMAAAARFRELRAAHRRIGTNDLRIACVALERGAVLVTRNLADFRGLPGLETEDWSR